MRQEFAESRTLTKIGNSIGVTQPLDVLRDRDLVDEEDQPRDVGVNQAIEERDGGEVLVTEIPLEP